VSPEPTSGALIGQTLGKRYLVRRLIGSGGMGAVYEVEHLVTKRIGALKLLHPRYASVPEVVARFVMEASAAGRIDNPHVVQTFDAGELESGEPYMFMELLTGAPVSALIQRRGRLRFDEARELVLQAAAGLSGAHAAGIVHRDVKPENLFVCSGERPFVKVLDFGISKFTRAEGDPRLTTEGAPLGTPYYMSPEQVVGQRDLDQRTDVYSLGVVLYECVTGEVPFKAETLPALGIRISQGQYQLASERVSELPRDLDAVIARAMSIDANDRFPDMPALASALSALASAPAVSFAPTLAADSMPPASAAGPPNGPLTTSANARSFPQPAASPTAETRVRRGWLISLLVLAAVAALVVAFSTAGRSAAPTSSAGPELPSAAARDSSSREPAPPAANSPPAALSGPVSARADSSAEPKSAGSVSTAEIAPARAKGPVLRKPSASASRAEKDGLGVKNPF
jgi:serine/threonine-protein kinase